MFDVAKLAEVSGSPDRSGVGIRAARTAGEQDTIRRSLCEGIPGRRKGGAVMKAIAIVVLCLGLSFAAHAGQNPDINIFLADENGANYIEPPSATPFNIYVCLESFGPGGGLTSAALKLTNTTGAVILSYNYLLSGGFQIGSPTDPSGWLIGGNCTYPDGEGVVVAGVMQYIHFGGAGLLEILPHESYGRATGDCAAGTDEWCVRNDPSGHFGIYEAPYPGDCGGIYPEIDVSPGSFSFVLHPEPMTLIRSSSRTPAMTHFTGRSRTVIRGSMRCRSAARWPPVERMRSRSL